MNDGGGGVGWDPGISLQGLGEATVCTGQDYVAVSRMRSNYRAVQRRAEPTGLAGSAGLAGPTDTTRIGSSHGLCRPNGRRKFSRGTGEAATSKV
jgi:hypothetical protein